MFSPLLILWKLDAHKCLRVFLQHSNRAAMQINDSTGDREAKAASTGASTVFSPIESLKHVICGLICDPSGVAYIENDLTPASPGGHRNAPGTFGVDRRVVYHIR
jgi:hypothetical protein